MSSNLLPQSKPSPTSGVIGHEANPWRSGAFGASAGLNAGHALELGGLTVTSKLNEPLGASIEVNGVATDSTANTLVVSLASAQAHAAAGIPLDPVATNLIFTLNMLSRPAMVEIDSRVAIRVPFTLPRGCGV